MQDKLRAAFAQKERADIFLANLEKLREEKTVGDSQYRVLKIEYTQMREEASSRINTLKTYVKRELEGQVSKLDVLKQELSYLEARFKVGQLSANDYLAKEKTPKRKLTDLEKRISELQTFLNAANTGELGMTTAAEGGLKILGLNLGFGKKQLPPAYTGETGTGSVSTPVKVENVPPPPPPPPPPVATPPPPPPPPPPVPILIKTSGLQIMPSHVMEGGSVGIIVIVTNITNDNIVQNVPLKINGEVKESRKVDLLPGQSQELTFVQLAGKQGNYQVDIVGVTGKFTVAPVETVHSLQ